MTKEEFNLYCAEVMGCYPEHDGWRISSGGITYHSDRLPDYFNDSNQRHEVFDKLWKQEIRDIDDCHEFGYDAWNDGIDQAEIKFIWSTKEDK